MNLVVDVNVNRWDLMRFNFATIFRIRANLVMFGIFWAIVVFGYMVESDWSLANANIFVAMILTFLTAFVGFLVFFVILMAFTLLSVTEKSGWIGRHQFSIEEQGIRQVTEANDSLHSWESVNDVRQAAGMLMVRVSQYNFFLMPKHGFADPRMYDSFCAEVTKRWRASQ